MAKRLIIKSLLTLTTLVTLFRSRIENFTTTWQRFPQIWRSTLDIRLELGIIDYQQREAAKNTKCFDVTASYYHIFHA
ncbi:MAG: hypothetical protein CMJ81_15185 [Planctomycetaceae bacterium]|nr:hypothetical protein [Planctomycetaceae bacterium]